MALLAATGCTEVPCRTADECPIGSRCVVEVSREGNEGTCVSDCVVAEDCAVNDPALEIARCDNEGQCRVSLRPPRARILDPENDTLLAEGTRSIRLSGEVDTVTAEVRIDVTVQGREGCSTGDTRQVIVKNPEAGRRVTLSFVVEDLELDPGLTQIQVRADVGGSRDLLNHLLEVPCPGCANIQIDQPPLPFTAPALELPRLEGRIDSSVRTAIWRVRGESGGVFDGLVLVEDGRFALQNLPLFTGFNRIQIVASGVGQGLGESRCSAPITSAVQREHGLRLILSWDGLTSDLDLHLIGPGGTFADPMASLSSRTRTPFFGGDVRDDFDGLGPEVLTVETPPDGVYGLIVEPVFDDRDPGSNAFLRVLYDGRQITAGPIGPDFLSSELGDLWIAGTITVSSGNAQFTPLGDHLPAGAPPSRPPSEWPVYR